MNKKEFIKVVAQRCALTQKDAEDIIKQLSNAIIECLAAGEEVHITNFGKFFLYQHPARPVRNPKTMEEMIMPPIKTLKFKAGKNANKKIKKALDKKNKSG